VPAIDPETAIGQAFPDLRLRSVEVIGRGWDSTAYLVNGETVFRLPIEPAAVDLDELRRRNRMEIALLHDLRGKLPVATPVPDHVAPDLGFFGYPYLAGTRLEPAESMLGRPQAREQFVDLWLDVVDAVARVVTPQRGHELGLRPLADLDSCLELVDAALTSGVLPRRVRQLGGRVLDEYGDRYAQAAASRPIAMHADLGTSHWLLNGDGEPYAVIDWSDACLAPVENELANLYWTERVGQRLVDDAASGCAARFGIDVDRELVDLTFAANALSDIGLLLLQENEATEIAWVVRLLESLRFLRDG
jgi:aminoglycoside phosphotransferase (APT) family kinase protein